MLWLGGLAVGLSIALAIAPFLTKRGGNLAARLPAVLTAGKPVPVSRAAPFLALPPLEGGGILTLHGFRGKVVVLNFWASWCTVCREEAPILKSLWRTYQPRGVQFLGIDYRDVGGKAITFERHFGISYPSAVDVQGSAASRYGVVGLPTTYLIGTDGRIHDEIIGKIDPASFRAALDALLGSRS